MARVVDNNGIGSLYATFDVAQNQGEYVLASTDIGAAVAVSGDNQIGLGSDGGRVLGRLENLYNGLATVQLKGVCRFALSSGKTAPTAGDAVVVDGAGKVYQAPALVADDPAGGNVARGITLAVDGTGGTCDVLL